MNSWEFVLGGQSSPISSPGLDIRKMHSQAHGGAVNMGEETNGVASSRSQ